MQKSSKSGKTGSRSPLGIDAIINGELHHLAYLQLEYPKKPNERPADLAPDMPGFYTISVRARVKAIRWMEQCFASGSMRIELQRNPPMIITYSQPVDSLTEMPRERLRDRLIGLLSASFGFYRATVVKKSSLFGSKITLTA